MLCPNCKETRLVMSERKGIEIDYCPQCRGVWLDRGELDKLLERSVVDESRHSSPPPQQSYEHHHGYKKHHRKSFWHEIFD